MIQLLIIRQFGRDCEAVVSNEGPEYGGIIRDYHPYTLQECLERVDYGLRVLYIHQMYREEGDFESFCNATSLNISGASRDFA